MPPTTEPVAVRILDDILATMELPDGGSDYFHDVKQVRLEPADIDSFSAYPAVGVFVLGTVDGEPQTTFTENTRWRLALVGILQERGEDAARALLRMIRDIHRALMIDRRRGVESVSGEPNAVETHWLGWDPEFLVDEADSLAWAECRIEVHFRTSDTDLTEAR